MTTVTTTVRLASEDLTALRGVAASQDRSLGYVLREAIREFLAKHEREGKA